MEKGGYWGMKKKLTPAARKRGVVGWLLNAPYLVYSLVFFLIPLIWAAWLSTMEWNLMSKQKNFVGIDNFAYLSIQSFKLTFIQKDNFSLKYLFNYNSVLNVFLRDHFQLNINWLTDQRFAFSIMVGIVVWKMSGYYALFILSGIESIGADVNEACALDGSHGFHKLIHVTLPMIMPTLSTVIVLATGLAFGIFTEPFLLTGGGPNLSTTSWQLEIYNTSFTRFQSGYGAAMAIAAAVQIFITLRVINFGTDKLNKRFGF